MRQENLLKMLSAIHDENILTIELLSNFFENREEILNTANEYAIVFNEGAIGELPDTIEQ